MTPFGAASDPGKRGGDNQDAVGTSAERAVWFIADGMGGHGHGQTASGIVRETLLQRATADNLVEAIDSAHAAILDAVRDDPGLTNMGSTVVACAFAGSSCRIAWVGDSRAYLCRNGELAQLTVDHSLKQLLLAQNESALLPESAADQNALVRALGMEVAEASFLEMPLCRGDLVLLCSDGLTREVSDPDIASILSRAAAPQAAADALLSQALANGGHDNVSAIVIAYHGRTHPSLRSKSLRVQIILSLAGGALAAAACVVAWAWFSGRIGCDPRFDSRTHAGSNGGTPSVIYAFGRCTPPGRHGPRENP